MDATRTIPRDMDEEVEASAETGTGVSEARGAGDRKGRNTTDGKTEHTYS